MLALGTLGTRLGVNTTFRVILPSHVLATGPLSISCSLQVVLLHPSHPSHPSHSSSPQGGCLRGGASDAAVGRDRKRLPLFPVVVGEAKVDKGGKVRLHGLGAGRPLPGHHLGRGGHVLLISLTGFWGLSGTCPIFFITFPTVASLVP